MRPWQNKLAILAGFLVAGALFPWSLRLVCAFAAIVIVMLLLVTRLRTHAALRTREHTSDVLSRVERIRAGRTQLRPGRDATGRRIDREER